MTAPRKPRVVIGDPVKPSRRVITVDQWHAIRGRLYAVLAAGGPLLVFYGVASSTGVALWSGVIVAALGNGLAATNVVLERKAL